MRSMSPFLRAGLFARTWLFLNLVEANKGACNPFAFSPRWHAPIRRVIFLQDTLYLDWH